MYVYVVCVPSICTCTCLQNICTMLSDIFKIFTACFACKICMYMYISTCTIKSRRWRGFSHFSYSCGIKRMRGQSLTKLIHVISDHIASKANNQGVTTRTNNKQAQTYTSPVEGLTPVNNNYTHVHACNILCVVVGDV